MKKRAYRQSTRAEQARATGERIVRAAMTVFDERGYAGLTLAEVAARSGVTPQTVIRRFGDKEGLVAAARAIAQGAVRDQRDAAVPGDLSGIVTNLVEHYEAAGVTALRLLADEHLSEAIAEFAQAGRDLHEQWCERVFEPWLATLPPEDRTVRRATFVAVCDVYTWHLLRQRAGLTPEQTRAALLDLLSPLTLPPTPTPADRKGHPS